MHLDTSFLIDWWRTEPRVADIVTAILAGEHDFSIDPIVETEFFAAPRIDSRRIALFEGLLRAGRYVELTAKEAQLAASWLAPMDERQRRAHFADALIAAVALVEGATLVTGDRRVARVFPALPVLEY
ncbi:MAG: PIN domain-containing protein [Dehalococcoidia bacterium]